MKKEIGLSALLFMATFGIASAQSEAARFANDINAPLLKKHLSIIASDEFEGRETGQKGSLLAADYIAAQFKKFGLEAPVSGSYFQSVPLIEKSIAEASITVNGAVFKFAEDFLMTGNSMPSSLNLKEAQLLFAGYGINSPKWNDFASVDVNNKVVLVLNGEPIDKEGKSLVTGQAGYSDYTLDTRKKLRDLQAMHPKLILAVYPNFRTSMSAYAAQVKAKSIDFPSKQNMPAKTPVVYISEELATALLKQAGKSIPEIAAQITATAKPQTSVLNQAFELNFKMNETPVKAMNVMGFLPGTDLKDEVLVLSSHYDHIGIVNGKINNGADDDGSGTTSVLAMAQAFADAKKAGKGPRRSILFLTFTGEEKGLLGSQWYSDNPVFPLDKTITDLNTDMVGRIDDVHLADTNYVYLIGSDKLSTDLHKTSEEANAASVNIKLDYKYNDPKDPNRFYYRSDHYNFAKHGVPVIFYFNGVHADYHQPGDKVEKIHFDLMAKRVKLIFTTAWELANKDKRPVVDVKNDFPVNR
ncbi:M28 family peptidase [Solitalea sp. MAHUQ-68]|uniref:M28 family peptidase n=1 Tax=Solitalea agri TaxID=2953739 RepID=A0A9X2F3K8_9SPHI|nr:M28 family peptidase [Solitalea agri]MCO4293599.1 M28 family peptidase [Solitalea agri]